MSVLWHRPSDVRLWVFLIIQLKLSPIVVEVRREGGVRMSILWHWSPNIWLRILLSIQLNLSPVIVEMARES
jgi:hypothetical protein